MTRERWFVFRVLVAEDAELDEECLGEALSAAEEAANKVIGDGVRVKMGPDIDRYREQRPHRCREVV